MSGIDSSVVGVLALDGMTTGMIYVLLALATVLVFSITRIMFIPQGAFVTYGALTLAMLQLGKTPGTIWLLLILAGAAAVGDIVMCHRHGQLYRLSRLLLADLLVPVAVAGLTIWAAPRQFPLWAQAMLTLAVVTPIGPLLFRVAYQSLADASVLLLLIVSVGVHFVLTGLGLYFFGAEAWNTPPFWDIRFSSGVLTISGQGLVIVAVCLLLIALLWLFFEKTLYGMALRATAVNRLGAQLMGVSTTLAGRLSLGMAAFVGALSGMLIGASTPIFYDSGFLIGLKGFVAAIFGGLASYPAAAVGALFVGLLESFGAFWASEYKDVIVFVMVIPVLLWLSLGADNHDEEE